MVVSGVNTVVSEVNMVVSRLTTVFTDYAVYMTKEREA